MAAASGSWTTSRRCGRSLPTSQPQTPFSLNPLAPCAWSATASPERRCRPMSRRLKTRPMGPASITTCAPPLRAPSHSTSSTLTAASCVAIRVQRSRLSLPPTCPSRRAGSPRLKSSAQSRECIASSGICAITPPASKLPQRQKAMKLAGRDRWSSPASTPSNSPSMAAPSRRNSPLPSIRVIQALQSQSDALKAKLPSDQQSLANALSNTTKQAGDILTGGPQGSEQGLEYASRGLTVALTAIESADRTPPSQVIELYQQSAKLAASRLAQWQKLKASLAQLNRELSQTGLKPLDLSEH